METETPLPSNASDGLESEKEDERDSNIPETNQQNQSQVSADMMDISDTPQIVFENQGQNNTGNEDGMVTAEESAGEDVVVESDMESDKEQTIEQEPAGSNKKLANPGGSNKELATPGGTNGSNQGLAIPTAKPGSNQGLAIPGTSGAKPTSNGLLRDITDTINNQQQSNTAMAYFPFASRDIRGDSVPQLVRPAANYEPSIAGVAEVSATNKIINTAILKTTMQAFQQVVPTASLQQNLADFQFQQTVKNQFKQRYGASGTESDRSGDESNTSRNTNRNASRRTSSSSTYSAAIMTAEPQPEEIHRVVATLLHYPRDVDLAWVIQEMHDHIGYLLVTTKEYPHRWSQWSLMEDFTVDISCKEGIFK